MDIAAFTHPGPRRRWNEDACFSDSAAGLLVVADSQGGDCAGVEFKAILENVAARFQTRFMALGVLPVQAQSELLRRFLNVLAMETHLAFLTHPHYFFGSEVTACYATNTTYALAHVGGCRAYLVRGHVVSQLTQDHRWAMEEVRAARLSLHDALEHPLFSLPTRMLSHEPPPPIDTRIGSLSQEDRLVLVSDGVWRVLSDEVIARVARDCTRAAEAVVALGDAAIAADSPDNLAVAVALAPAAPPA